MVASKPVFLVLIDLERRWRGEGDPSYSHVGHAIDFHGQKRLAPIVRRVFVTQSNGESVRTGESPRRKLIIFLQAGPRRPARQPVKETACGSFEQQAKRIITLRRNVHVKTLVA